MARVQAADAEKAAAEASAALRAQHARADAYRRERAERQLDLAAAAKISGLTRYSQAQRNADPNYQMVVASNERIASYVPPSAEPIEYWRESPNIVSTLVNIAGSDQLSLSEKVSWATSNVKGSFKNFWLNDNPALVEGRDQAVSILGSELDRTYKASQDRSGSFLSMWLNQQAAAGYADLTSMAQMAPTSNGGLALQLAGVVPMVAGAAQEIRIGNVEGATTSRMSELQAKWGGLTAGERRALLDSKSEATWSNWLDQRNAAAKAVNPHTHFLEKHGPGTTLLDQEIRASTKLAPDGSIDPVFRDSTRFLSNRNMGAAMQRADSIFHLNGGVNKAYSFNMEGIIGEGYTKSPGLDWMFTTNVNAVFRNGQPYTMFPLLRPIP
jgi:hypothetical protein